MEWKSVGIIPNNKWKVIKFHGSSHHQPEIVDLRIETSDFPGGVRVHWFTDLKTMVIYPSVSIVVPSIFPVHSHVGQFGNHISHSILIRSPPRQRRHGTQWLEQNPHGMENRLDTLWMLLVSFRWLPAQVTKSFNGETRDFLFPE